MATENNLLDIKNLKVTITKKNRPEVSIIKGIDLALPKGEIIGIVGESGSGKSMTMKSLMSILPEDAKMTVDSFSFDGKNLNNERLPGAMIFQDPMTALNPLRTIGYHLIEVVRRYSSVTKQEAKKIAVKELIKVGISLPEKRMTQYPHELSGGMRQRVLIAMALLAKPKILIADEPTTALDVTVQAQILDLIRHLQQEEKLTVVLVTHDFGIVAGMCQSIKVMYQGQIVEEGTTDEIFYEAAHPYTKELLRAIPSGDKNGKLYAVSNQELVSDTINQKGEFQTLSETHRYLS
ncbi:ABC transporter ATP-binding protein [Vagococcus intermedius]|uniref:ABC transporter ATP-binding protein n=1 Tax=Vagococcus intermedius TaxID=2991418 RepID=A0AAF0I8F3_9ENTE|nr:ABC transporter ATP-binding protein [Vagococcus intermedius]WEG72482.1 ABC transporter ATP-binding protein [Vagococcus intermedius]WEG74569.1 ABC transporter ATP-binding protein [Vagococcus intermedius]